MKRTRFSEQQIVQILREADQTPVSEVAERQGVSDATIYAWRKRFGQLQPADVKIRQRTARCSGFFVLMIRASPQARRRPRLHPSAPRRAPRGPR
jgi:putative transposase